MSLKTNLELNLSILRQVGKVDASTQKDGGSLRDPIYFPSQVLEER